MQHYCCSSYIPSGDTNLSLRKNIVDKILKLYRMTCQNLTIVNDNLSRAQGIIEVSCINNTYIYISIIFRKLMLMLRRAIRI